MYKDKNCELCGVVFIPTSPNQKHCSICKDDGDKIANRIRDRKRNRNQNNYKERIIKCGICGVEFKTYYQKKSYCGSDECELERKRRKNRRADKKRNVIRVEERRINREVKFEEKLKEIKEYIESQNYTLLDSSGYINSHSGELLLKCSNGHEWETTYHNFKDNNNRCLQCYISCNYISKPEQKIRDIVSDLSIKVIYNDRSIIPPKELDLYFPDHNLAIEVCGLYWHSEVRGKTARNYHYNKMIACQKKGIRLITIFEDEIDNNIESVKSRILQALGFTKKRIYARNCEVRVIDKKILNDFLETNHLQGKSSCLESWGLFNNNELVMVCSIGKLIRSHTNSGNILELKRLCSINNVLVIGGASKLFKHIKLFCKKQGFDGIKSYCDMRYANIFSPIYEILGFKLLSFTKYTPHYIKGNKRFRNFSLRKTIEERLTNKTEFELRLEQGYDRIWDCGHRTYYFKLN